MTENYKKVNVKIEKKANEKNPRAGTRLHCTAAHTPYVQAVFFSWLFLMVLFIGCFYHLFR